MKKPARINYPSEAQLRRNRRRRDLEPDGDRCCICELPLSGPGDQGIWIVGGGGEWIEPDADWNEPPESDLGWHPIGTRCLMRLRKEAAEELSD